MSPPAVTGPSPRIPAGFGIPVIGIMVAGVTAGMPDIGVIGKNKVGHDPQKFVEWSPARMPGFFLWVKRGYFAPPKKSAMALLRTRILRNNAIADFLGGSKGVILPHLKNQLWHYSEVSWFVVLRLDSLLWWLGGR